MPKTKFEFATALTMVKELVDAIGVSASLGLPFELKMEQNAPVVAEEDDEGLALRARLP